MLKTINTLCYAEGLALQGGKTLVRMEVVRCLRNTPRQAKPNLGKSPQILPHIIHSDFMSHWDS